MMWRRADRSVHEELAAQLPDALALENRPLPFPARTAVYAILGLILTAIVWASLSTIDRFVIAPGKLTTTRAMIVIQPLDPSIIRAIAVRAGDRVRAGQLLARLDPTFTAADQTGLRDRLASLDAQIGRLQAERGTGASAAPANLAGSLQADILRQRRAEYSEQLANLDGKIAELRAQADTNRKLQAGLAERLEGLESIHHMRENLHAQGYSSEVQVLQARDAVLTARDQIAELRGQYAETLHRLTSANAERASFTSKWHGDANQELVEAQRLRDATVAELRKAERRDELTFIRAPVSGAVLSVAARSVGSVLQPAEPFITIVPANARMEAEVMIETADISLVHVGDRVKLKLESYPFQRYGTIAARLRQISPDAVPNPSRKSGRTFYRATATLLSLHFDGSDEVLRPTPGMNAIAEIDVGHRSVISYLLYPVIRVFDEGMKEPR